MDDDRWRLTGLAPRLPINHRRQRSTAIRLAASLIFIIVVLDRPATHDSANRWPGAVVARSSSSTFQKSWGVVCSSLQPIAAPWPLRQRTTEEEAHMAPRNGCDCGRGGNWSLHPIETRCWKHDAESSHLCPLQACLQGARVVDEQHFHPGTRPAGTQPGNVRIRMADGSMECHVQTAPVADRERLHASSSSRGG